MRYRILEPVDVCPLIAARAPKRRAAERRNTCRVVGLRDLIQHVLCDFVRMTRPARPNAETWRALPGAGAHVGWHSHSMCRIHQKLGHRVHTPAQATKLA